MFSSVLEVCGYHVVVVGRRTHLAFQPQRVGGIAIEPVPPRRVTSANASPRSPAAVLATMQTKFTTVRRLARSALLRRLGLPEFPRLPAKMAPIGDSEAAAITRRLVALQADLILALDPPGLAVASEAVRESRARGNPVRLAYDRSRRPAPGSRDDDWEQTLLGHVDVATTGSTALAQDDRWPGALGGGPVIYPAPVELSASPARFASLRKALKGKRRPRVGLFLPATLSKRDFGVLRDLLRHLADSHVVIFGDPRQLAGVALSSSSPTRGITLQPSPDPDELPQLMPCLDVVVCPSLWHPGRPPSPVAVASVTSATPLVASHAVTRELEWGLGTSSESAAPLARTVREASTASGSGATGHEPAPRPMTAYAHQVAVLREHLGGQAGRKLGIGPRNGNGQAWAWAQALRQLRPALPIEVFAAGFSSGRLAMSHEADLGIPLESWQHREWQLWWAHRLRTQFTDLLIEQGLATCGWLNGKAFYDDLPALLQSGLNVGLVFRGSEIRNPSAHAEREPWSPFRDSEEPLTAKLQTRAELAQERLQTFDVPRFVTTLDLLDDVPDAQWLPQVLDVHAWSPGPEILTRSRPVVLHAPSRNELMKGSQWVDQACQPLHDAGVIDYQRLRGVPFAEMPDRIRGADIVIDQLALGSYGVLALQAMASQRLVIGHVSDRVRSRLKDPLPVLQAEPPALRSVLEEVLAAREWARSLAPAGRDYVCRHHSGEASAQRLIDHLVDR